MRPVIREIEYPADPFAWFRAISGLRAPFFLDSAQLSPRLGRWSFMGAEPFATMRWRGRESQVAGLDALADQRSPFQALSAAMSRFRLERQVGDPPFLGGAVGYWGYELRHFVERVPRAAVDDAPVPDCCLGFYDAVIALDHVSHRAFAIAAPMLEAASDPAVAKVERFVDMLARPAPTAPVAAPERAARPALAANPLPAAPRVFSNFSRDEYLCAVMRAKEYIACGDTFQINLSQRLTAPATLPPVELYQRLRSVNPSPFAAFIEYDDFAVLSASPERFLQVRGDDVETRPIKGTRPRGATPDEDQQWARALLASDKDRAENVMIVDLERNDLGRTCAYGTIRVTELCALEAYPNVFHLVSTVVGRLHAGHTAVNCLRACFPGGSITGAPKVRSIEIINELEPTCRGVYTGAIGYVCFSGDMDTNIVIRTIVVKDGWAHFQVGGGIVADSDPEAEYQETFDKARGLIEAVAAPDQERIPTGT